MPSYKYILYHQYPSIAGVDLPVAEDMKDEGVGCRPRPMSDIPQTYHRRATIMRRPSVTSDIS